MIKILLPLFLLTLLHAADTGSKPAADTAQNSMLKLSLQVMLYNNDLQNGAKIVDYALKRDPNDPFWLSKAAQIALWRGEPQRAKRYYLQLYKKTREKNALQELRRLAHATDDREITIFLDEEALGRAYDPKIVKRLYDAYYAMGYLERGAAFFHRLETRVHRREAARAALLLEIEYAGFTRIAREYHRFRRHYGFDADLLYRYAKRLFAKRAYREAFIEIAAYEKRLTPHTPHTRRLWRLYTDLAMVNGREEKLLEILQHLNTEGILPPQQAHLYLQLLTRHAPQKALRYALKLFYQKPDRAAFYSMATLAVRLHAWDRLEAALKRIDPRLRKTLEREVAFHTLCAQLWAGKRAYAKALSAYEKALRISPDDLTLHQAYLWTLLDADDLPGLQREVQRVSEQFSAPDALAKVLALAWLRLEQAPQALQQIKKCIRNEGETWQNLLLYADIAALSGEEDTAENARYKAWQKAQKALRRDPALLEKQSFCYDYLRLALRFHPLSRKKYLKMGKRVLSSEHLIRLYLGALDPQHAPRKMLSLLQRLHKRTPSGQLLTATLRGNREEIAQQMRYYPYLPLWDRISAAQLTDDQPRYLQALFTGMQKNPSNGTLRRTFTEAITARGPQATLTLAKIRRDRLDAVRTEGTFTHYASLEKRFSLSYRDERFSQKGYHATHRHAAATLYARFKDTRLRLKAGVMQKERSFATLETALSSGEGAYRATAEAGINMEDDLNNALLLHGRKNRFALRATYRYDSRHSLSFQIDASRHMENNSSRAYGNALLTQFHYRENLRLGYPDLSYTLFLERQNFWETSGTLPDDYWQGGLRIGIGESSARRYQRRMQPYVGATLLYNTRTHMGYSLTAGTGRRFMHRDSLKLEGAYASGIGLREEDYLSIRLKYLYH